MKVNDSYKIFLVGSLVSIFLAPATLLADDNTVNVLAWADVFPPKLLAEFTKKTGIKVVYDTTPSDEVTETKLLVGHSGYDVVSLTVHPYLHHLLTANALTELDPQKIPNLSLQDTDLSRRITVIKIQRSVGLQYWGTTGIALTSRAKAALPSDAPLDSLALIFEPKYAQKLGACGMSFLDSPVDMIPLALLYLGIDPESSDEGDLSRAVQLFAGVRPYITKFDNTNYRQALANGDICAAVGWGGDIILARDDAVESKQNRGIEYIIPKEGGLLWMNGLIVPKDAPHTNNAHAFINFVLSREAGDDLAKRGYSPAFLATLLPDQTRYPNSAERERLHYYTGGLDADAQKRITRAWTHIKYQ